MKIWISKYALTKGIYEVEGEPSRNYPDMLKVGFNFFHRGEWHRTKEEAIATAEKRRQRRISSLKKSLAAMEGLSFS